MATATDEHAVQVKVAPDKSEARLVVPSSYPRDKLDTTFCATLLQEQGVEITDAVMSALQEVITTAPQSAEGEPAEGENTEGETTEYVVAKSQPLMHGPDGYVEWLVHANDQNDDAADRQSHYDRTSFIMVKTGDMVGVIHPEEAGTDGRDVTGKTLAAKDGKPLKIEHDESIIVDSAGQLVAQSDGVLTCAGNKVHINNILEIQENVDFSTGNIDFGGSVHVHQGVKDCFIVKAQGDVEVKGLIEAAEIDSGGSLFANGGFTGREQGKAAVGQDLSAKYLDGVHAEVRRNLCVQREIINSHLTVHGEIDSPGGAMIGGQVIVTGKVHLNTIGSAAAVATELVLDTVPGLDDFFTQLTTLLEECTQRKETLEEDQKRINTMTQKGRMTAADKERQTEIMFELSEADHAFNKAEQMHNVLKHEIEELRTLDLNVQRKLNPGVRLTIRGQTYVINTEVRGPLQVYRDGHREIVYKHEGGSPILLRQIADVEI